MLLSLMPCQGILEALWQKVLLDQGNPPGLATGHTVNLYSSSLNLPKTNKIPYKLYLTHQKWDFKAISFN